MRPEKRPFGGYLAGMVTESAFVVAIFVVIYLVIAVLMRLF